MKKLKFLISVLWFAGVSGCLVAASGAKAQESQTAFWVEARSLQQRVSELYQAEQYEETAATTVELISQLETELGSYSSAVISLRSFLAKVYEEMGDRTQSLTVLADAARKQQTIYGLDHPDVIESLRGLGVRYWQQGDYAQALSFFEQSLTLPGTDFSRNAWGRSAGSENLSALSPSQRDYASTLSAADRSLLIHRALLDENQLHVALEFAKAEDALISSHLQTAPADTEAATLPLSFILRYKGYLLDKTTNISQQLWQEPTPNVQKLYDDLRALRDILQTLSITDTSNIPVEQYVAEISRIENKAAETSLQLTSRNAAERAFSPIPIQSIQREIPANAALVEIVRYQPTNADGSENPSGSAHYAAYVLAQQGVVGAVDLGKAATIDDFAYELRQSLATQSAEVKRAAHQLHQRLIAPLEPFLSDKTHLIISPDSQLNLIPFEVLVNEQSRYLVESHQISYVASGRDLLRLQDNSPSRQKSVIIANPDYDSTISPAPTSSDSSIYSINSVPTFAPLPGTATEAALIAPLLPEATVLTGSAATEGQLNQLQGPRLLHIATHGFFLSEAIAPNPNSLSRSGLGASFTLVETDSPTAISFEESASPLFNSGLVLAGANTRPSGIEDGILTAMEALGLNLQGTQLVTLSACETGVGTASDGEGVHGLRRAFAIAGAESQLMSLWQVDDTGTSELMQIYYKNLIEQKQGRSEALRNAQLELLNTGTYQHPYYWSSFILSGDWRPLE